MPQTMDDVVETLKNAKGRERKCSVLIGSGCSVSAGVPTAPEFVEIIKEQYPRAYERASEKTYPIVMGELSIGEQRDLIAKYIDNAKINWGHIALAQLMKDGYVDRVLTTNFDPLVIRACALLGIFPAVYDFAASQNFEPDKVPDQAVYYLHGQRSGFILLNSEQAVKKHADLLSPVFDDTIHGRVWLVVGYSGNCDPVFDHLAKVKCFDNRLYWIGYKDNEPEKHVIEGLLTEGKSVHYIKGYDSDNFFVTLAQKLGIFPPDFMRKPFTYLNGQLSVITDYTYPGTDERGDLLKTVKKVMDEVIKSIEKKYSGDLESPAELIGGNYQKVVSIKGKTIKKISDGTDEAVAWAYYIQGLEAFKKAQALKGDDAIQSYILATTKYKAALIIKPDWPELLNNYGVSLAELAKNSTGVMSDRFYNDAYKKFSQALTINPNMHEVFFNWGSVLDDQAMKKGGKLAENLLIRACEKYKKAIDIKPDKYEALCNWGLALKHHADINVGIKAEKLYKLAYDMYQKALSLKPDFIEVYNNWGIALKNNAKQKNGTEADILFEKAYDKFGMVIKLRSDDYLAYLDWGNTLVDQAKTKREGEADNLFEQAYEKFSIAINIRPNEYEAYYNWGVALSDQARLKTGEEADKLFDQTYEKFKEGIMRKPNDHNTFYKWGIALLDQAISKSSLTSDTLLSQACYMFENSIEIKPDDYRSYYNWGNALVEQAKIRLGESSDSFFERAYGKFKEAVNIKVNLFEAYNSWGVALCEQAKTRVIQKANRLYEQAYQHFGEAIKYKSNYYEAYYNWGDALLKQAKAKGGDEYQKLTMQAELILLKAEKFMPGYSAYKLACISLSKGEIDEFQKWLIKSKKKGFLPKRSFLETEKDLNSVRGLEWFKEFIKEVE